MEYRILGMERKIALGLGYLVWPLALIAVLTGKKEIDREDRVHLWVGVFSAALGVVPIVGYVACAIAYVFCIISARDCNRLACLSLNTISACPCLQSGILTLT